MTNEIRNQARLERDVMGNYFWLWLRAFIYPRIRMCKLLLLWEQGSTFVSSLGNALLDGGYVTDDSRDGISNILYNYISLLFGRTSLFVVESQTWPQHQPRVFLLQVVMNAL